MSEVVQYKSKLKKIESVLSVEELCKSICDKHKLTQHYGGYWKTYTDIVYDFLREKYYIDRVNGVVYEIETNQINLNNNIFEAEVQEDGSINLHLLYYDGGCGYHEAIGIALSKFDK